MISFDILISHLLLNFLLVFTTASKSETPQEWNARINQKIDLLRKNDARIVLDKKIYGTNVKLLINQTKISFPMGTAIKAKYIANCLDQGTDDKYCQFVKENYNYVVIENGMKWPQWEPRRDEFNVKNSDKAIAWAIENAIRVRGHCLFWAVNGEFQIPNWIKPLTGDDLREAIDHRVTTAVTHFDGQVEHWDVNNEMLHGQFYVDGTNDPKIRAEIFKKVEAISPNTLRFVNDYNVLLYETNAYVEQIQGLLADGANITGIGAQAHLGPNSINIEKVEKALDTLWNTFGIPIWITEFDWTDGHNSNDNHAKHATELENFYRLLLSHEGVGGILMWGFWNKAHWKPDAAIVDGDDLVPNLAGEAYMRLYHEEFRTNEVLTPNYQNDDVIVFKFRGFKGTYNISAILEDGTVLPVTTKYMI